MLDRSDGLSHGLRVSIFITGTDTDVGKTYVTRLILETLRRDGIVGMERTGSKAKTAPEP